MTRGNQAFQREVNTALVMRFLRHSARASRAEISRELGLTKSTVSSIVSPLLSGRVLLEEEETLPSTTKGGRRATALRLNPQYGTVLGIELLPDTVRSVRLSLDGTVRRRGTGTPAHSANGSCSERPNNAFLDFVRAMLNKEILRADSSPLIGVSLGLPAYVRPTDGRIMRSFAFDADGIELARPLAREYGIPVLVENDANCLAWDELGGNTHRNSAVQTLLALIVRMHRDPTGALKREGAGIGMGIVVDGRLHYGPDFQAGEFRSNRWKSGTAGQLSAGPAEGERETAYVSRLVAELFENLSVVSSLLRPDRIVYGGDLLEMVSPVNHGVDEALSGRFIDPAVSGVRLEPAQSGEYAVAQGAAAMFIERLFELPSMTQQRAAGVPLWSELIARGVAAEAGQ